MCVICIEINRRLLTWERPEWRQAARRSFSHTDVPVIVSSHSNV